MFGVLEEGESGWFASTEEGGVQRFAGVVGWADVRHKAEY